MNKELMGLIMRLQSGDGEAFDRLYDLTKKSVYYHIRMYIKDNSSAEDIMQEVYLSFMRHIGDIRPEQNILAYIITIARNMSINFLKKESRYDLTEDMSVFTDPPQDNGLGEYWPNSPSEFVSRGV